LAVDVYCKADFTVTPDYVQLSTFGSSVKIQAIVLITKMHGDDVGNIFRQEANSADLCLLDYRLHFFPVFYFQLIIAHLCPPQDRRLIF